MRGLIIFLTAMAVLEVLLIALVIVYEIPLQG